MSREAGIVSSGRWRGFLHLPTLCAVCHDWGSTRVCGACLGRYVRLVPRCGRCAIEVPAGTSICGACLLDPPAFDAAVAAVDYAYPWNDLVAAFKFRAGLDLADALATQMVQAVERAGQPLPQWLLPVPLAPGRLRERGYDQAWELCRRLAKRLGVRSAARAIRRLRETPHQAALARPDRVSNVAGAFFIEPRHRDALRGSTVAVIDDVLTTGATLDEIARLLRRHGVAGVQAWVVARTPKD